MDDSISLRALEKAMKGAFDAFGARVKGLEALVLDLQQKRALGGAPIGGGSTANASLTKALAENDQLRAMARGELRGQVRIVLPGGVMNTAITGPVAPGSGPLQDPDRASGIVAPAMRRMTVRALLPSLETTAGATQYTRQSAFTNNAEAQGAGSSPEEREGQVKGESAMTFELVTVPVVTIAHWIPASSQVLSDVPALQQHINTWLAYGLALIEEDELLNGAGGNVHIEGLIGASTAFNRSGSGETRADTLRKAITQLQLADHVIGGFVLNPTDAEALDLLKDTTGQYLRVVVDGRAWNVPVISTNAIAAGTWLAGDFSGALLRPRQGVTIEVSNSHSDFFVRNLIAIRAELREALEIHRPLGFVTGTF
jgi:HK97 family phage major capsid protein